MVAMQERSEGGGSPTARPLPEASWMENESVRGAAPDPRLLGLSGLESMRAAWGQRVPAPPIHHLVGLRPVTIGPAAVSFTMPASPRLRSDAGVFHAGTAALWPMPPWLARSRSP